eukprot:GFUD01002799.1.p1 GENE.GFUD01002799.1~~GFUD01002799.1.p1  ORF type:complete len:420 (-),score=100.16 GFUD01002799.1:193-1452(-)
MVVVVGYRTVTRLMGVVNPTPLGTIRFQSLHTRQQELQSSKLQIELASKLKAKPAMEGLAFGQHFTDHMLTVSWNSRKGWGKPKIRPFEYLRLHPASKVFHYAQELYEGMKAYRGVDGQVRLFRPMLNMDRMNMTAERSCLPDFDSNQLLECIRKLIVVDLSWVPSSQSSSLYIRPTMIGTEGTLGLGPSSEATLFVILSPVGSYFSAHGIKPVNLLCDPRFVRATPGGCGYTKMGSNYAPTLWVQKAAEAEGCEQVLWVFGEDQEVTEVGAMNIFIVLKTAGGCELVTPPLSSGTVLPGVTRRSIIELAQTKPGLTVVERRITLSEIMTAKAEGRLVEMFGSGTAAIVSPVGGLKYNGVLHKVPTPQFGLASQFLQQLSDIYYGNVEHPWAVDVLGTNFTQVRQEEADVANVSLEIKS